MMSYPTSSLFPSSGLVAYYKMEGNWNDSTANANNGTSNNITYSTGNGKILQGGGFNGTSSNITIPNSTSLNITSNEISFSFWIYPTATLNNNWVLFKWATSSQWVYSMWFFSGTDMKMYMRLNGSITTGSGEVISSWVVSQNVWTHIAGVYNWSTQKIYINWTEVWSQNYSSSLTSNTNTLILWYYFTQTQDFQWNIDEVWIWNRWLTATEVSTLYNGWNGLTY